MTNFKILSDTTMELLRLIINWKNESSINTSSQYWEDVLKPSFDSANDMVNESKELSDFFENSFKQVFDEFVEKKLPLLISEDKELSIKYEFEKTEKTKDRQTIKPEIEKILVNKTIKSKSDIEHLFKTTQSHYLKTGLERFFITHKNDSKIDDFFIVHRFYEELKYLYENL